MSKTPIISMIAAIADDNVIGDGEKMLWHIPEDFKLFRDITTGKPIIMGRKTYDSIGRPLPKRHNIVLTRDASWTAEGVDVTQHLDDAIEIATNDGVEEICIIGGGHIYRRPAIEHCVHGLHWPGRDDAGRIHWVASGARIFRDEFEDMRNELGSQFVMKLTK